MGIMQGGSFLLAGILLLAVYIAGLTIVLVFGDPDYYEDVLETAEYTYNLLAARKDGVVPEAVPKNVKLGKLGLGGGWGASAFYYKHSLENRRSRKLLIQPTALVFAIVSILFSLFMKGASHNDVAVLAFSVYMLIFSAALGRFNKELTKPFVYMVPEPSMTKLIQCTREMFLGAAAQAILIFVPVGIFLSFPPLLILSLASAHMSFSILFTAGLVVLERLWSGVSSKGLAMMLYIVVLLLLALPGTAAAIAVSLSGFLSTFGGSIAYFVLALCNAAVAALAAFLCRDMLDYADFGSN
jgi:hypothetical protein